MPRHACCDEPGCRRTRPLRLYLTDFGDRVFLVTRSRLVKAREDGTATLAAVERHDISDAMRRFITDNADWVRGVLETRTEEKEQSDG